jgi:hypothetical protein
MFSDEVGGKPTTPIAAVKVPTSELDVSLYSLTELLTLRNKIDALLPPMSMKDMDLEQEVVRQFMTVKALQGDVLGGNDEANKKASVVNACAAALQTLAKMQVELHNAERFKRIENLMIKHLKLLPKESVDKFLDDYARLVADKPGVEKK